MVDRRNFNTEKAPRMNPAFPQAVIANKLIFLSGMPGLNPTTGQVVSPSFEDQARQAFANIQTVLQEAGSDMGKVVKTTIFMVAGNDFGILNQVYADFFPAQAPARSTPQVLPFPAGMLISIECIALV